MKYPLGFIQNITIYTEIGYRNPSFCSYNIVPSEDDQRQLKFTSIEEYERDFLNRLKDYNEQENANENDQDVVFSIDVDEFMSYPPDANIEFSSGYLNLKMNGKSNSVKLPSFNEVSLGNKSTDSRNILNTETDQSDLLLNSTSSLRSTLNINVPDKVESFSIRSLSLQGNSDSSRYNNIVNVRKAIIYS